MSEWTCVKHNWFEESQKRNTEWCPYCLIEKQKAEMVLFQHPAEFGNLAAPVGRPLPDEIELIQNKYLPVGIIYLHEKTLDILKAILRKGQTAPVGIVERRVRPQKGGPDG